MSVEKIKDNFTREDWEAILDAPFLIGLAVSDSDIHPEASSRELDALMKVCGKARDNYPENPLIMEALDEMGWLSQMDEPEADPQEIRSHFEKIAVILDNFDREVSGHYGRQFKEFLFQVGLEVAKAYSEEFFGLGKKISDSEQTMLEMLRDALGLDDVKIR